MTRDLIVIWRRHRCRLPFTSRWVKQWAIFIGNRHSKDLLNCSVEKLLKWNSWRVSVHVDQWGTESKLDCPLYHNVLDHRCVASISIENSARDSHTFDRKRFIPFRMLKISRAYLWYTCIYSLYVGKLLADVILAKLGAWKINMSPNPHVNNKVCECMHILPHMRIGYPLHVHVQCI